MSAEGMRAAGTGLACLDKGMANEGGLRIIRRFVRNTKGVLEDTVLSERSPLLFEFLKTLMQLHGFENVALQRMTAQDYHCDPHAKSAPAKELHILLTVNGSDHSSSYHCFGLSTSPKIPEIDDRYRTWDCSSGSKGSAAVKVQEKELNDVFLLPRAGERPLQAVDQALLAGRDFDFETQKGGPTLKRIVTLHAGVSGSHESKSLDDFWKSSRQMQTLRESCKKEFNKKGVEVSDTMLANFRGTPEAAACALENAAQLALDAHALKQGSLIESQNKSVIVHLRDLEQFKEMLRKEEIGNLLKGQQDYWSFEKRQVHVLKCVEAGGSKAGKMEGQDKEAHALKCVGQDKEAHVLKCVEAGGSKAGKMEGQDKEDHALQSVQGGGHKVGKLEGQALQDAGTLVSQAAEDRREGLLNIANGVAGGIEKWTCESYRSGNFFKHHFLSDDTSREPIIGEGKFEDFVLNDDNGFGTDLLTPAGAQALQTLKNRKRQTERDRDRRKNRGKRGGVQDKGLVTQPPAKKARGSAGAAGSSSVDSNPKP
jgi:hypothetical protein